MAKLNNIVVTFEDGRKAECPIDTPVSTLLTSKTDEHGRHYLGAVVNNQLVTLMFKLEVDSSVRFLTFADPLGWRIYRATASFLLAKVVKELFPDAHFSIEHSLSTGFYCYFERDGIEGITEEQIAAIDQRLKQLIAQDVAIERHKVNYGDAVKAFEQQQQQDKLNLLRFGNPPKVVIYTSGAFADLSHGPLAASAGAVTHLGIVKHKPGFVLQFPDRSIPPQIPPLREEPQLFNIFQEHKKWGRILNVNTVGRLNEIIANKEIADFIRIAEALHEKKIAQIADHVAQHRDRIRWLLIAGPSSSGKTTFAKRLAVQLRVSGLQPVTISVDNYFVDRNHTPKDEKGDNDYEHIEAIDLKLFNDHLCRLDAGEKVELPTFNFQIGQQEFKGNSLQLKPNQMVILEGIHCLNPRLTEQLANERKFKIYISALTQLNLDSTNRISTTDNRLVRRLVRDNQFRGHSALVTMNMWPSVRRGEKTWIFPFQGHADIAFNSALDYELAVLKPLVEPLLAEVKPDNPSYVEARRMQEFLASFLALPSDLVPPTSLLREFVGKSGFRY
ncbi:MAG: nucleoside kinase [Kiritimatiellae bacterium]|nr:nucleoside kinase [Kiritimatiellia bacterium]